MQCQGIGGDSRSPRAINGCQENQELAKRAGLLCCESSELAQASAGLGPRAPGPSHLWETGSQNRERPSSLVTVTGFLVFTGAQHQTQAPCLYASAF